jgi:SAM-dependent methyltransferase
VTGAVDRWSQQLAAWALPRELMEAVAESPYGWPAILWKRRAETAAERAEETPTLARVAALGGPAGSVLDVGAGTGRASLPLARRGYRITAVEPSRDMLAGLRQLTAGLPVRVVEGSWPAVAVLVEPHSVALSAHVVYDVADIGPFLKALHDHATAGVVIELTAAHPWAHLSRYYRILHDLDRPAGPTAGDLAEAVAEATGVEPHVQEWSRPPDLWFESTDELLELYGRRLVLPRSRWPELRALLAPDIVQERGRFRLGSEDRVLVTIWWET